MSDDLECWGGPLDGWTIVPADVPYVNAVARLAASDEGHYVYAEPKRLKWHLGDVLDL